MFTLSRERWQEISPYLDQALSLPENERAAWLESFRAEKPEVAAFLGQLLEEHRALAEKHFLEHGPAAVANESSLAGQTIGAYRLISSIGQGGMGSVWLAERSDGRFERRVAVKFLHFSVASGGVERFKREGRILGQLAHPHIAELIDAGVTPNGEPYLVLEHVEGEHIDESCDKRGLNLDARLSLFLDVLSAVAHAHANLIVHRDIKPSNVLVRNHDGQVKLLDFGIAKMLADDSNPSVATSLTLEGGGALTPQFAAPEQVTGVAVTTATDVYELGVLLYLLLTGQHPVGPGPLSSAELVKAIVDTEPPRASDTIASADGTMIAEKRGTTPEKLQRQLRGDLDTILRKALKKVPQERYASVVAFADDLRRYLKHEPISARPDTIAYRTRKFVRRNRVAVALTAFAIVAMIAGGIGIGVQARTARLQRDFATNQLARAEAINDLNTFLISDVAPSGKPFTALDLLARAEQIVERRQAVDNSRIELLTSIGDQYQDLSENTSARRVLEHAYQLSRAVNDATVRSRASCALAVAIAHTADTVRAEALFQEGVAELGNDQRFALDRAYCLLCGDEVARERGSFAEAQARVRAAEESLQRSPVQPESMELAALTDLAESYRISSRHNEAVSTFELAWARLVTSGRDNTATAAQLLDLWALALEGAGRPLEAEPLYLRALAITRSDSSDRNIGSWLLRDYATTLRDLGKLDEAEKYARRAYSRAQEQGEILMADTALLQLFQIYLQRGDTDRAEATMNELGPRIERDLPSNHYVVALWGAQRGLLARARGHPGTALVLLNNATKLLQAAEESGHRGSEQMTRILIQRSQVELELGYTQDAVEDARLALHRLAEVSAASLSCDVGRAYLALGRALQAQGNSEEARSAFRSAAEHLDKTLGSKHPESRAAHELAGS